jgi:hypothetical protein
MEERSDNPFSVGVGGSSGSSGTTVGKTPRGGERRSIRPRKGSISSSSSVGGGGSGLGEGRFGVLRGRAAIPPVRRRTGLFGGAPESACCPPRVDLPISDRPSGGATPWSASLWGELPGCEARVSSLAGFGLAAVRRSRTSGFERARLDLVGDA